MRPAFLFQPVGGGIVLACLLAAAHAADTTPPVSWRGTFGTHYALAPESCFGLVRGWPQPGNIGFNPDVTDLQLADVPVVTGRFSGEPRRYDFEGRVVREVVRESAPNPPRRGQDFTFGPHPVEAGPIHEDDRPAGAARRRETRSVRNGDYGSTLRAAAEQRVDVVYMTGQINHRQKDRVEFLMAKNGAYFKDLLYAAVTFANTGTLADRPNEVFWEIGNEVNSPDRFSVRDHGPEFANPAHAADYVEYYLAPAVEAIRAASQDLFGDPRRVKIVCGNVSGILKERSREFLDALLNTTIRGEHAPTLAGKRAWEIVDIVAIHYSGGDERVLAPLHARWIASGRVAGLWSTEEMGWRGTGDYCAALVSFRWLDFWARRGSPAIPARLIFWGDRTAHQGTLTQGEAMERHLGAFLQDFPLVALHERSGYEVKVGSDFEIHALRADAKSGEKRYVLLALPYPTGQAAMGFVRFPSPPGEKGLFTQVAAFLVPREGPMEPIEGKVIQNTEGVTIDFQTWEVRPTEMVLVHTIFTPDTGKQ